MITKGCAKENQCWTKGDTTTSGTQMYDGTIQLQNSAGYLPAGMTITPLCCLNKAKFPTDDATISWAPGVICNNASRASSSWWWMLMAIAMVFFAANP